MPIEDEDICGHLVCYNSFPLGLSVERAILALVDELNAEAGPVLESTLEALQGEAHQLAIERGMESVDYADTLRFVLAIDQADYAKCEAGQQPYPDYDGIRALLDRVVKASKNFVGNPDTVELSWVNSDGDRVSGTTGRDENNELVVYQDNVYHQKPWSVSDNHPSLFPAKMTFADYFTLREINDYAIDQNGNVTIAITRSSCYDRNGGWWIFGEELVKGMIRKGELETSLADSEEERVCMVKHALSDYQRVLDGKPSAHGLLENMTMVQTAHNNLVADLLSTNDPLQKELNDLSFRLVKTSDALGMMCGFGEIRFY